jgi:hypothetical protein
VVDSARPIWQTGLIPVQSTAGVQGQVGTLASIRVMHAPMCSLTPSAGAVAFSLPAAALRQLLVTGLDPLRDRSLILDQVDGNPRRQRLPNAILCPRAGLKRAVQCDAQIGACFDHLPVPRESRDVSQPRPIRDVRFGLDTEVLASFGECVVDPCRSTMDDH